MLDTGAPSGSGAEGTGGGGFCDSNRHGLGSVLTDQFEQLGDLPRQGAIRVCQIAQIRLQEGRRTKTIEESHQALLRLRPASGRPDFGEFGLEALGAESLAPAPGARIRDDLLKAVVDGDRAGVGLERDPAPDQAGRHAVAIPVELHPHVLMHQGFHIVPIVRQDRGQRPECVGLKEVDGALASFTMQSLIGDLIAPFARLAVDVGQVGELTQGPEILADISDASALDLSFFPTGRWIASPWVKVELTSEGEKARMKPDQTTIMFGDSGR